MVAVDSSSSSEVVQISEIPAYALDTLNEIAVKEGFIDHTIKSSAGSNHGDGFLGIMVRVTIEGLRKQADGAEPQPDSLPLICKMPPADKVRRVMFNTSVAFTSEIYVYDEFFPELVRFQLEKNISQADGFFEFPKSYGTFSDAENGDFFLAMEDLKVQGYDMWNKHEDLDFAHASLVMQKIGKFHALSFALRDQRPELFAKIAERKPGFFMEMLKNDMSVQFWDKNYDMASKSLEPEEKELYDNMQTLRTTFKDKLIAICTDPNESFSVLNHGDFWNNNMMYRYANGSKVPQDLCLIDWQIVQFGSPAMDLSHFLFSSTNTELREEHYDDLLRVYYDSLAELLQRLGSDPEQLFKFTDFLDQLKKFAKYGFLLSPMFVQVTSANQEDIPDLDLLANQADQNKSDDFISFVKDDNPLYNRRMSSAIRFFFSNDFDL